MLYADDGMYAAVLAAINGQLPLQKADPDVRVEALAVSIVKVGVHSTRIGNRHK